MKIYFSFLLAIFLVIVLVKTNSALTCTLRSNSCAENETCLFSTYQQNNSHLGNCSEYTYKVCCDRISSANIRASCNADEGDIISVYATTNSHAAEKTFYTNKICAKFPDSPVTVTINATCDINETCIASIFSATNAHVGECGYFDQQICLRKLPDLTVNQGSIDKNVSSPVVGDPILFNITVWNIGDSAAVQVNVSCYDNGIYFGSSTINSVPPDPSMAEPRYANCIWSSTCPASHNISVRVDPANSIQEYNETNNEAWTTLSLIEKLNLTIDKPADGSSYYRGQTIPLESTVSACSPLTDYNVTWYNSTHHQIATGEDTTWTIPLDYGLGPEIINANVNKTGYLPDWKNVTINILNNLPTLTTPNVVPTEIYPGDSVEISCTVTDVEDSVDQLSVNISVKDPYGMWSNTSASRIGNTFYRNYSTDANSPLGYYTAVCSAEDTDNGYNESATSQFLVYQTATILITLNATEVWWNDPVNISIQANRGDKTAISNGEVVVNLSTTSCAGATDDQGKYSCVLIAPSRVGTYTISVNVTDPQTDETFSNSTTLTVKIAYGETKSVMERAKNVGCYEVPRLVQNPDGTITKVMVRVCAWK